MSNELQNAARTFRRALQPLVDAFQDPAAADVVRETLRLPPNTQIPQVPQGTLDRIDAFTASADPTLDAAAQVVDDVIALVAMFRDLIVAASAGTPDAVAEELVLGLLSTLTLNAARRDAPAVYAALRLLGFVEQQLATAYNDRLRTERVAHFFRDAWGYIRSAFQLDTPAQAQATGDVVLLPLAAILRGVVPQADVLYGWDAPTVPASTTPNADEISRRTLSMALTGRTTSADVGVVATLLLGVIPVPAGQGGPGMFVSIGGSGTYEIPIAGDTWTLGITLSASDALSFLFAANTQVFGATDGSLRVEIRRNPTPGQVRHVVGEASGTRFEYGEVSAGLEASVVEGAGGVTGVFDVHVLLHDAVFVVRPGGNDGFLARVFGSSEVRIPMELGIGFATNRGVYLTGSTSLKVTLPLALRLGPLRVPYVVLELKPSLANQVDGVALEASAGFALDFGPFKAVVDQLGVSGFVRSTGAGLAFKPPKGIGLALKAGCVEGGGYLFYDADNRQYAGAFAINVGAVAIKGFALVSTIPGPPQRDSVFALVSVEWPGGWPIGFGFTINGLGLMAGVNRTVDTDRLLAGVKDHLLDSLLFPSDPISNAPQIVSNLNSVFPPSAGRYVIGAMAKIQWGKPLPLLTVNLGLAVEFGTSGFEGAVRVLIMGQMKLATPTPEAAVVKINVDLVGVIDTGVPMVAFNASLTDSKILQWTLTGDAAFRWRGGEGASFLLSFGGFHPSFTPPAEFPRLDRLAISLSNGLGAEVRCEAYLAVTSNTFQIGARAGAVLRAGGFSVEGHLAFDALIQFSPFRFQVDIDAGIAVKRGNVTLISAHVHVTFSGPAPFHLDGRVEFSILFVSFSVHFETSFGTAGPPDPVVTVSVAQALTQATADRRSWDAPLDAALQGLVTLRSLPVTTDVLAHPLADLAVRQQVAPLGVELAKFGTARIDGPSRFSITSVTVNGADRTPSAVPLTDQFARGDFFTMTDAERLSSPSFDRMNAGVRISAGGVTHGPATEDNLVYETIVVDPNNRVRRFVAPPYRILSLSALAQALDGAAAATARTVGRPRFAIDGPRAVVVTEPQFTLADTGALRHIAEAPTTTSFTEARAHLDLLLAVDPQADAALVAAHEVRP